MNPTLAYKIKMLPESPGCYIMKSRGEIIYVGKAVNLKNRVRQYFHGSHTPKVAAMVSRVDDFDLMLCQTNFEALTLECNLIKKHRPFYNILLKDDKHYPYLRIDLGESFPRLTLARNMDDQRAGVKYFGPYIGATAVRQVMDEVRRFFPAAHVQSPFSAQIAPAALRAPPDRAVPGALRGRGERGGVPRHSGACDRLSQRRQPGAAW